VVYRPLCSPETVDRIGGGSLGGKHRGCGWKWTVLVAVRAGKVGAAMVSLHPSRMRPTIVCLSTE
jgi:hypothetical protein